MLDATSVTDPPLNCTVLPVTDTGLMGLLKVTLTPAFVPILVEEFAGATATMVGAAVSVAVPAVKVYAYACTATPSVLVMVELPAYTSYVDPATRLLVGAMVMTPPLAEQFGFR